MSSTIFFHKKYVEKYFKNDRYSIHTFNQKYFLICESCFWMASTIPSIKDIGRLRHKKCPICESRLNRFLICEESL